MESSVTVMGCKIMIQMRLVYFHPRSLIQIYIISYLWIHRRNVYLRALYFRLDERRSAVHCSGCYTNIGYKIVSVLLQKLVHTIYAYWLHNIYPHILGWTAGCWICRQFFSEWKIHTEPVSYSHFALCCHTVCNMQFS